MAKEQGSYNIGTTATSIFTAVQAAGGSTALAAVLIAWIRQRKSNLKLKITRGDGTVLEVDAQDVVASETLIDQIGSALETAASVQVVQEESHAAELAPGAERSAGLAE
ncbi:hypothetical protein AGRA3207_000181 [Actinomadura graeca]|uniref:Uncharacterized protein n=1 Tax=Actinomadura graeca TaxID=2750812 RepID=A0ABX8QLS2_9ACTN|nr:hypothetical protein [Actinomadura graeca]QXJ19619.1 hypothetical protein AGRA3207_000181 [Actinomadura graeca]